MQCRTCLSIACAKKDITSRSTHGGVSGYLAWGDDVHLLPDVEWLQLTRSSFHVRDGGKPGMNPPGRSLVRVINQQSTPIDQC